jgi:predicted component of viral defense system (DUF524 family)
MSSIFSQDWRDCLDAHYRDVVQRGDTVTESSLSMILYQLGYREDELKEMKLYATMRTENLQADFIPTLDVPSFAMVEQVLPTVTAVVHPEELVEVTDEPVSPTADEAINLPAEVMVPNDFFDTPSTDVPPDDDVDLPQQLSMF